MRDESLVSRLILACVLMSAVGCGVDDYEAKQQPFQARLDYFDEENKLLKDLMEPLPKREGLDPGSVYLRLPKGIPKTPAQVANNDYLFACSKAPNPHHNPYMHRPQDPNAIGDNFDKVYVAVVKDLGDKSFDDFKAEVLKGIPELKDEDKVDRKEITKKNLWREKAPSLKFQGYVSKPPPPPGPQQPGQPAPKPPSHYELYFLQQEPYAVAIGFKLADGQKQGDFKKQIEMCLQSLAVGPEADALRSSFVPRDPPSTQKK